MSLAVRVLVRLVVLGAALAAYYASLSALFPDDGGGANIGAGLIGFAGLAGISFVWSVLDGRRTTFLAAFACWAIVSGVYAVGWLGLFALTQSDPSMGTREMILLSSLALVPVTVGNVLLPAVAGAAIGSSTSSRIPADGWRARPGPGRLGVMPSTIDLEPAGDRLLLVAANVTDEQLTGPTPDAGRSVGQLLAHIVGLCAAFRAAADKDLGPLTDTNPDGDGWPDLEQGWRAELEQRVPALVEAWRSPAAWQGMTRAGGVDLPGEVAGLVALDELVLHGWDLARATGQDYTCDEASAAACLAFVEQFDPAGTPGLFGSAVPVAHDATTFERALAGSGRDPGWRPG